MQCVNVFRPSPLPPMPTFPLRFLNTHRIFFYSAISFVSVCAVVANALKHFSNFYAIAIHLSKSSRSVLVLANSAILLSLLSGHVVQRIFFGSLRPNEVEVSCLILARITLLNSATSSQRLYDRLWFFITESLLAFTIFRDEFDTPFGLMFGFLLFIKSFHWLASDRIEWVRHAQYLLSSSVSCHLRRWTRGLTLDLHSFFISGWFFFLSFYGQLISSCSCLLLNIRCRQVLVEWFFSPAR